MGVLRKRLKTSTKIEGTEEKKSVSSVLKRPVKKKLVTPVDTTKVVSTGSTLLDLAISGGRIRGGGLPAGIMVELFGPSSSGKTTVLVEIGASVQNKGGEVDIRDPEARLDKQYTEMHGLSLPADNYSRPDTVTQVFDDLRVWSPKNPDVINLFGADSIAALSSDMEMEKGDARGQKKAKDLSEGCRKTARVISKENKLIVFTNQERQSEYGKTTPGGFAIGYHSSVRIRIARQSRIEPEKTITGTKKKVKKTIGIISEATIVKSSVDDEYRKAPIYIIFGFGIDDVRANLQWYKDHTNNTKYLAVDKEYQQMNAAINYIESNNLELELREMVIDLWESIEELFKTDRKKKVRF
jgi:recombination protein RecA